MMAFTPNVKVKVDHRGRMQVFVEGQRMAGVTSVNYESLPTQLGTLRIEISGMMVDFEQLPRPTKETARDEKGEPVYE